MLKEFKEFIMRGSVMDMAVGVVMGSAFSAIVTALVDNIIMPVVGMLIGGINFDGFFVALDGGNYATLAAAQAEGAPVLAYGSFIQTIINFLIISLCIFFMVKGLNKLRSLDKRKEGTADEVICKVCPYCREKVDIAATRCSHCTSVLEQATAGSGESPI